MSPTVTKENALQIIRKLRAEVTTKRAAHDLVEIYYKGVLVSEFGLRRGSRRDAGHGFIPSALHLSLRDTLDLAHCPLSYEGWVEKMKDKGLIVEDEESEDS